MVEAAARTLGVEVITAEIQQGEDIVPAFEALNGRADALYVCIDPLVNSHRIRINTLALAARLPTNYANREAVEAGGLMSYGPNQADLYRRAADYVDKILRGAKPGDIPVEQPRKFDLVINLILRGAKPGDIPVEQPRKFDLVINLTTAKALRLTIPESFLLRADEVVE